MSVKNIFHEKFEIKDVKETISQHPINFIYVMTC